MWREKATIAVTEEGAHGNHSRQIQGPFDCDDLPTVVIPDTTYRDFKEGCIYYDHDPAARQGSVRSVCVFDDVSLGKNISGVVD